ncbi:uncharacterized protein V1518DRAFT_36116 [Limtongia smithiae]|uniref:uncharacterized protein n=1 Tax=Limtongia smithiae TaxID=1125753 RepID=UPI0034CFA581
MVVLDCNGLPSPNPSVDYCFSPRDEDSLFERAFQRDLEDHHSDIDGVLPSPRSECPSTDDTDYDSGYEYRGSRDVDLCLFLRSVEFSLFYPDTAPRDSWRPQLETWMRRNSSVKPDRFSTKSSSDSPTRKLAVKTVAKAILSHSASHSRVKHSHQKQAIKAEVIRSAVSSAVQVSVSLDSSHSRQCISCGSDQSPCWRPSWSIEAGQLCNSCGLRYKKTGARCLSRVCGRIPSKGEWVAMRSTQPTGRYSCLYCGSGVAVGENMRR